MVKGVAQDPLQCFTDFPEIGVDVVNGFTEEQPENRDVKAIRKEGAGNRDGLPIEGWIGKGGVAGKKLAIRIKSLKGGDCGAAKTAAGPLPDTPERRVGEPAWRGRNSGLVVITEYREGGGEGWCYGEAGPFRIAEAMQGGIGREPCCPFLAGALAQGFEGRGTFLIAGEDRAKARTQRGEARAPGKELARKGGGAYQDLTGNEAEDALKVAERDLSPARISARPDKEVGMFRLG